jgi:hypothetical protein
MALLPAPHLTASHARVLVLALGSPPGHSASFHRPPKRWQVITARPKKWVLFNGVPVKQMAADDQGTQLDLTDFKMGSEGGMVLCQLLVRTLHSNALRLLVALHVHSSFHA